ncbi:MAG: NAD-dependent epimerase/dehydratase family protein [Burkholderiales bacterium]
MRVFVTGSSSHLARALLPRLCEHAGIEAVTGVDLRPPQFSHPRFSARRCDIRDARLAEYMENHNILINMAFIVLRGRRSEAEMFDVNVKGSHAVFHAARRAGVSRLIHLSSAAVYGSGTHLAEDAALTPLAGFLYGQHKAQLERLLADEFPECVRLRPHAILGPHAQPLLRWLLHQPCYLRLPEPQPRLQCVHEDDVVQAILLGLERKAHGAFNLAADDSFSFRDVIRRRHRLSVPLPPAVARSGLTLAWKLSGWGGEPAWIAGLTKPLLLDCRRARLELGWHCCHSAAETLEQV